MWHMQQGWCNINTEQPVSEESCGSGGGTYQSAQMQWCSCESILVMIIVMLMYDTHGFRIVAVYFISAPWTFKTTNGGGPQIGKKL